MNFPSFFHYWLSSKSSPVGWMAGLTVLKKVRDNSKCCIEFWLRDFFSWNPFFGGIQRKTGARRALIWMAPLPLNLEKNKALLRVTDEAFSMPCLQKYENNEDETRISQMVDIARIRTNFQCISPLLCFFAQ